ncbi:MAG TPA: hypothetical protein VK966_04320 [Longimicrobiales bacterium]|nr:hypothetical protein [Longimicrobiales bacterium]
MPTRIESGLTEGVAYASPFVGRADHTLAIRITPGDFTTDEVDAHGYLKPGVPLDRDGALVGAAPAHVFGCVAEAVKIADDNAAATLAAADAVDVAVVVLGVVNRDVLEDILGRALTADEAAGFDRAGSKLVLSNT